MVWDWREDYLIEAFGNLLHGQGQVGSDVNVNGIRSRGVINKS